MSRTTKPLTTTEVDKAKPKDKIYRLYDGKGLVLNITPSGGKYWYLQYQQPFTKKSQMFKLGDYPDLSLAQARMKVQEFRQQLANNIAPKDYQEKLVREKQASINNDFRSVYEEWIQSKDYAQATTKKLETYVNELLAIIGNKPVQELTVTDCLTVLRPIERAGHLEKLKKTKSLMNQVMIYAVATGKAMSNPVINLQGVFKSAPKKHNPAILDEARLAEMVKEIDGYQGKFVTKKCVIFSLYMFARQGEIRNMRFSDVDLDKGIWDFTPTKTKNSTQIKMLSPLPRQAIEIIRQLRDYHQSDYVFASPVNKDRPLSDGLVNRALRRLGFEKDEQTAHGFRAIARTLLEEKFKYDYRMIEMQLGHQVRDSNGRAYNRVTWLDERREMMQVWADYIDSLK